MANENLLMDQGQGMMQLGQPGPFTQYLTNQLQRHSGPDPADQWNTGYQSWGVVPQIAGKYLRALQTSSERDYLKQQQESQQTQQSYLMAMQGIMSNSSLPLTMRQEAGQDMMRVLGTSILTEDKKLKGKEETGVVGGIKNFFRTVAKEAVGDYKPSQKINLDEEVGKWYRKAEESKASGELDKTLASINGILGNPENPPTRWEADQALAPHMDYLRKNYPEMAVDIQKNRIDQLPPTPIMYFATDAMRRAMGKQNWAPTPAATPGAAPPAPPQINMNILPPRETGGIAMPQQQAPAAMGTPAAQVQPPPVRGQGIPTTGMDSYVLRGALGATIGTPAELGPVRYLQVPGTRKRFAVRPDPVNGGYAYPDGSQVPPERWNWDVFENAEPDDPKTIIQVEGQGPLKGKEEYALFNLQTKDLYRLGVGPVDASMKPSFGQAHDIQVNHYVSQVLKSTFNAKGDLGDAIGNIIGDYQSGRQPTLLPGIPMDLVPEVIARIQGMYNQETGTPRRPTPAQDFSQFGIGKSKEAPKAGAPAQQQAPRSQETSPWWGNFPNRVQHNVGNR